MGEKDVQHEILKVLSEKGMLADSEGEVCEKLRKEIQAQKSWKEPLANLPAIDRALSALRKKNYLSKVKIRNNSKAQIRIGLTKKGKQYWDSCERERHESQLWKRRPPERRVGPKIGPRSPRHS